MCPEDKLLSAYLDNEVPQPWADEMAAHIKTCAQCAGKIREYESLHTVFVQDTIPDTQLVEKKIYDSVMSEVSSHSRQCFWSRKIQVPVPALAAAAAGFFVMAALFFTTFLPGASQSLGSRNLSDNSNQDYFSAEMTIEEFEALDDLFESQVSNGDVTMAIPDLPEMHIHGDPKIMRAVEYSRSRE